MANDENLKRGNMPGEKKFELEPQAIGGALRRVPGGAPENWEKAKLEREETARRVREEQHAALEEIAVALTLLAKKLLNKAARSSGVPERVVMDTVREFRQTLEVVNEARKARGAAAEAEDFFATLDTRLAEAQARMPAGPVTAAPIPT